MAATNSFMAIDGVIWVGSTGMAVTAVATTAMELARVNGAVNFDTTFEKVDAHWRTRAIQDSETFRTACAITVEQVQFRASTLTKLMKNVTYSGLNTLLGTTATAALWRITTSTAPRTVKLIFKFTRTSDQKRMQVYTPKAEVNDFPMGFGADDFIKQNFTFRCLASGATIMEIRVAKNA